MTPFFGVWPKNVSDPSIQNNHVIIIMYFVHYVLLCIIQCNNTICTNYNLLKLFMKVIAFYRWWLSCLSFHVQVPLGEPGYLEHSQETMLNRFNKKETMAQIRPLQCLLCRANEAPHLWESVCVSIRVSVFTNTTVLALPCPHRQTTEVSFTLSTLFLCHHTVFLLFLHLLFWQQHITFFPVSTFRYLPGCGSSELVWWGFRQPQYQVRSVDQKKTQASVLNWVCVCFV